MSTFLATAVYVILALRTVRATGNSRTEFVPNPAVTVAMLLLIVSIAVLVDFLSHLTRQIQIDTMLHNVDAQSGTVIDLVYPQAHAGEPGPGRSDPPGQAVMLLADRRGFVQAIAAGSLSRMARRHGVTVQIVPGAQRVLVAGPQWPGCGRCFPTGRCPTSVS